jgi:orotidine-5'-phosphate decarboxylase
MTKSIPIAERLIFALDVDTKEQAVEWLDRLGEHVHFYKVGLQLFLGGWFPVIKVIRDRGHKVMVDLKFFDIPETVERAVGQLKDHGVEFITVHGNEEILKAANQSKNGSKILAVTLLTSFEESDLLDMGLTCDIETFVLYRAQKALRLKCDGVICSGVEAAALRRELDDQFLIVAPGIRPGANTEIIEDDQKRIASAYEAIRNGADHVVVGRPIRNAADPVAMVKDMHSEITRALPEN